MRIIGTVIHGGGEANINYKRQMPAAAVHCPEVAEFGQDGTINLRLEEPIDKGVADCWTPKIAWKPEVLLDEPWDQSTTREEEFGFVKIKLECPLDGPLYGAWIIFPSGHGATYLDPKLVEIITAQLVGGERLRQGTRCAVHLDHEPQKRRPHYFGEDIFQVADARFAFLVISFGPNQCGISRNKSISIMAISPAAASASALVAS
jgi:hypothetical protein